MPNLGEEDEEDDPKDWVDKMLVLGTWVVSWLDSSPVDLPCAATLSVSLNAKTDFATIHHH